MFLHTYGENANEELIIHLIEGKYTRLKPYLVGAWNSISCFVAG